MKQYLYIFSLLSFYFYLLFIFKAFSDTNFVQVVRALFMVAIHSCSSPPIVCCDLLFVNFCSALCWNWFYANFSDWNRTYKLIFLFGLATKLVQLNVQNMHSSKLLPDFFLLLFECECFVWIVHKLHSALHAIHINQTTSNEEKQ